MEIWSIELAKGIGRMFLHPVFYFSFILALSAGYLRVKRERRDFHVRVNHLTYEIRHLFVAGILAGLILSIISAGIGFILPKEIIIAIAAATIFLGVIGNARLLSPAYTIGIPLICLIAAIYFEINIPYIDYSSIIAKPQFYMEVAVILAVMLFAEGMLIYKNGLMDLSPKLRTSRRGLTVGAYQTKRLWFVPVLFFLPAGPITAPFEWWPVFAWGNGEYAPILLPFLIGFQIQIQSVLPKVAVQQMGKNVSMLGILTLILAACGLWLPTILPIVAIGFAILGRAWISHRHRVREGNTPYYFTPRNNGVMILGIIPDSPADKMELKTGEVIAACNGKPVKNKQELYEALLMNRAYCKLDVLDENKEIRFVQRALYEGDHHELGLLFVEQRSAPQARDVG
ncbi:PDZ domain-containing protein [Bacillus sp. FJAT-50079]|uniref:PDZ domain-containing protein n=1 Tax=Bacillus sp. FJAT-50079 TaxID=2833577 RepID=UPI001BCA3173|nr:PDZ domain-containing protein [Bacillus sp. FJAT-50079]MBS4208366.1 PDZ domain-containing protein [Bacillus sp. FJAT-50079]